MALEEIYFAYEANIYENLFLDKILVTMTNHMFNTDPVISTDYLLESESWVISVRSLVRSPSIVKLYFIIKLLIKLD